MSFYEKIMNDFGVGKVDGVSMDSTLAYIQNKNLILYFSQQQTRRMVSFKGFIQDFSMNFSFEEETQDAFYMAGSRKFLVQSNIEYAFTLTVPAANAIEAKLNLGRFEELSRMLYAYESSLHHSSTSWILSSFSNLIQSGRYSGIAGTDGPLINNYDDLLFYGAPCYLTKIDMKPDVDMGFFTTSEGLLPKVFTMGIQLIFAPQRESSKSGEQTKRAFAYFTSGGNYDANESKMWPFGVDEGSEIFPLLEHGLVKLDKEALVDFPGDASSAYASKTLSLIGFANDSIDKRFACFKCFLKGFDFSREVDYEVKPDRQDPTKNEAIIGNLKADKYKVEFDVVSSSTKEAITNHYKLQVLYRLLQAPAVRDDSKRIIKARSPRRSSRRSPNYGEDWGEYGERDVKRPKRSKQKSSLPVAVTVKPKTTIFLNNLIADDKNGNAPKAGDGFGRKTVIDYGVEGTVNNFSYAPDMELGFFEDKGRIFAKSYSISLEFTIDTGGVNSKFEGKDKKMIVSEEDKFRPFGVNYKDILGN